MEFPFAIGNYLYKGTKEKGCFGAVAKCVCRRTRQAVAVKVLLNNNISIEKELDILATLNRLPPEKYNIVKFIEYFTSQQARCMVFEILDQSLRQVLKLRTSLPLIELRPITQQLLVSLYGLRTAGVIHADLRPANIMKVHDCRPCYVVKLGDFGHAGYAGRMGCDDVIQPLKYRAPEVSLGYKVTHAADMWSLGCTLTECFTGSDLFCDDSIYNNLRSIIKLLGLPSRKVLKYGALCEELFVPADHYSQWRLKSPEELCRTVGHTPETSESPLENCSTLESIFQDSSLQMASPERRDRMVFADLIKRLLDTNPRTRLTPTEALYHPFVTMVHLANDNSRYSDWARDLMAGSLEGHTTASDLCPPPRSAADQ
ncbi:hypothetical protein WMY93_027639 [Mugilogobius chulae]|uniref:Protein kinase domain-containing protein n=1 Tax=Mugilogobius chulae TaxID=88201 RepID=A0AAW0MWZ2_9GOBI